MKIFQKDEFKFLGAFYLDRFISHIVYFAPAFQIIFFNQNLSLINIGILFSILAFSSFIFEIPTGAFADLFGRKTSTLFAYIMIAFLMPLFIFIDNFYTLIVLFSLWGFFGTFYSGAREAWAVDNLKYYKRDDLINSYYLKEYSLIMFGMFLSGILGAFIVSRMGINSIWVFAGFSWLISFFLLLPVKEHKLTKEKKSSFGRLFRQAKESINYSVRHKVLSFILLATFFIMFRDSFGGELIWQPFLKGLGFPIYAFGFLFSVSTLLGGIAPIVAKPLIKLCKSEKNFLITLMVIGMLLNFGVLFANNIYIAVIFFISILFLVDLSIPVTGAFSQKFIPSKARATIISFRSMTISLAYVISYPIAGFVAEKLGTQNTIVLGGLFLIPAIYLYSKINLKDKIKK